MRVLATMFICISAPFALADEPAANTKSPKFEQHFLEMMTHHHQARIEMAKVCGQKAQHADLKQICGQMASEQKKESDQMQGWLGSWYQGKGGMPKAEMDKMMAEHKAHMQKLNSAQGDALPGVLAANNEASRASDTESKTMPGKRVACRAEIVVHRHGAVPDEGSIRYAANADQPAPRTARRPLDVIKTAMGLGACANS